MKNGSSSDLSAATRESLLNATEELIAKHGVAGTSVRKVIERAKANLGAVNYHFGSKSHLVAETILRRLRPIDQQRLERLDAIEREAGSGLLVLEDVLDAFMRPFVISEGSTRDRVSAIRLLGRAFTEPDSEVQSIMHRALAGVIARFDAAFARALPPMSAEHLNWRVFITIAAMHRVLEVWVDTGEALTRPDSPAIEHVDAEHICQQLVTFGAAGLRSLCSQVSAPLAPGRSDGLS